MGSALEKHRGSSLDERFCAAAVHCTSNKGWSVNDLREACKLKHSFMAPGSFTLNKKQTFELFPFLQLRQKAEDDTKQEDTEKKHKTPLNPKKDFFNKQERLSTTLKDSKLKSRSVKNSTNTLRRSSSSPAVRNRASSPPQRRPFLSTVSSNKIIPKRDPLLNQLKRSASAYGRRSLKNRKDGHMNAEDQDQMTTKTKTTKTTTEAAGDKNKKNKKDQTPFMSLPSSKATLFNSFKQRNQHKNGQRHHHHHAEEASFFIIATCLGLSSKSSMEHRLQFLYELFHPRKSYGGLERAVDMDSNKHVQLLSMKELIFMSFTLLRSLNGIMYGHIDHIHIAYKDVKHSIVALVKNMEASIRGFDHKDGFTIDEFEKLVHQYVLPCSPWLYGVLKDGIHQHIDQQQDQDEMRTKKIDPYQLKPFNNNENDKKEEEDEQYGQRAIDFRQSSKGILEVSVISLASKEVQQNHQNESMKSSSSNGGTAFTAHLRPLLNRTLQRVSRKTKSKCLDGAGIVSWNSKLTFTDTGEGSEAARKKWKYGLDVELRVGEAVCGGCFVDMFELLDSGQFGVQVEVRSARKSDKVSWGGGKIGKIRISAIHINRKTIEEREEKRVYQRMEETKRKEMEDEDY